MSTVPARRAAVVVAIALLALGACGDRHMAPLSPSGTAAVRRTPPDPAPSASPSAPSSTPLEVPAADLALGDNPASTVLVPAAGTTVDHLDAATSRLLVDLPPSGTGWRVELSVEAPAGVLVDVAGDGSAGVTTSGSGGKNRRPERGLLLAGLVAPQDGYREVRVGDLGRPFAGKVPRRAVVGHGSWLVDDPDPDGRTARTVTLAAVIAAPGAPGSAWRARTYRTAVVVGTDLLASVAWRAQGEGGGGSYVVTPTLWGRMSGETGQPHLLAALRAHEPSAATDVVGKQLLCHAIGAPAKATWNLEPWRPDVSVAEYLLAACNPR